MRRMFAVCLCAATVAASGPVWSQSGGSIASIGSTASSLGSGASSLGSRALSIVGLVVVLAVVGIAVAGDD